MRLSKKNVLLILLITCSALISCGNKQSLVRKTLLGDWVIDSIYYHGQNALHCPYLNMLSFYEDSINIPPIRDCNNIVKASKIEFGEWEIIKGDKKAICLQIDSKNYLFKGTYKMTFEIGLNPRGIKVLKMMLKSDDTEMICGKNWYIVDAKNQADVDELIEMTK